jgi:hypothetical protein
MNQTELTSKLWHDLIRKMDNVPGGKRHAENLRHKYLEFQPIGETVADITEDSVYQKALDMLVANVEFMVYTDKLRRVEERRKLKEMEFWLEVYDATGINQNDHAIFNPISGTIQKGLPKQATQAGSYETTLDGFKQLIETALMDPMVAGQMSQDPRLPLWLQQMARSIITGDFKPNLRKAIEECISDPSVARQWHEISIDDDMPQWFADMTHILGARKKWRMLL